MEHHEYQEITARLRTLEETSHKTHSILRSMVIWRRIYWTAIILVVISGYIYLGPIVDGLIQQIKLLMQVVGS
jgi:hypothetical protein